MPRYQVCLDFQRALPDEIDDELSSEHVVAERELDADVGTRAAFDARSRDHLAPAIAVIDERDVDPDVRIVGSSAPRPRGRDRQRDGRGSDAPTQHAHGALLASTGRFTT